MKVATHRCFSIKPIDFFHKDLYLPALLLCLLITLLPSCAQRRPQPSIPIEVQQQQAQLSALERWSLKGKMAVKGGEKPFSANLLWQQAPSQQRVLLSNTLGITLAVLEVTEGITTLTADDRSYQDNDTSALLQQLTGIAIPFAPLSDWLKGQVSMQDQAQRNAQGLLVQLTPDCAECLGWVINYADYRQVEGIWLPHRLDLSHRDDDNKQIKLRIYSWTL